MRKVLILLMFLFFGTDIFAAYVAVLETGADDDAKELVSLSDRQYLTNVLREEAVKELPAAQSYTIMTRENIRQMLPPGKSIEDCEGSCLVETAKNIAADFICQARVGNFGGSLTLSAEIYETAGNKLIASFNGQGSDVNELLQIIREKSPDFFRAVREFVRPVPIVRPAPEVGTSIPANVGDESTKKGGVHWLPLGISAAATVAGVVLAVVGNNKAKDAHESDFRNIDEYKSNKDKAHNGQIFRGVGIGLAIAGAVGIGLSIAF
jgi:hypothetical protein